MGMSLDGFIEGLDRDISWHRVDEELHAYMNQELAKMGAFVGGRIVYELMEAFWPTADQEPDAPPVTLEFARIWRETPKIVYSRTLQEAGANTTIYREVVPEEVMALKQQPGGDLSLGGSDIAVAFREHDLIDEYRIFVHPVLIGRGKPLFQETDAHSDLRLVETKRFGNGVVMLRYERDRD
jgi:dihydrofolate reductase